MNLIDIRERLGPFWAAYQAERRRSRIIDNPDYVPEWFVAKLARERVAAARVALEQLKPPRPQKYNGREVVEVWEALRTVEGFLRDGSNEFGQRDQVVAGLLGAQEIETERERRDYEAEQRRSGRSPLSVELDRRHEVERVAVATGWLRARGITTSGELAEVHAAQDTEREQQRRAQWAALDAMAEEARA